MDHEIVISLRIGVCLSHTELIATRKKCICTKTNVPTDEQRATDLHSGNQTSVTFGIGGLDRDNSSQTQIVVID